MDGYWRESGAADDPGERVEQSSKSSADRRPPPGWPNLEAASTEKLLQALGLNWKDLTSDAVDLPRESQQAVERFEPGRPTCPS